jgi:manganese/zinc/iron transport system permease protein
LGIVLAYLLTQWLWSMGVFGSAGAVNFRAVQHAGAFVGAIVIGVATAWLTEWIQKLGRVESSAALGVVFTSLFALALLLIRTLVHSSTHLDTDCVLMGRLESTPNLLIHLGPLQVPYAAALNGGVLLVNLVLLVLFFKELRISAFDPSLATALGINARAMHYGQMAAIAVTIVAAFESVGSILVIAMLIAPAATAKLLTDRLGTMIALSLLVAALAGVLGHIMAIGLPPLVFHRLGYPDVSSASTTGMMSLAVGFLFLLALLLGPRHGVISKLAQRVWLSLKIACEDLLGVLYRLEEAQYQGNTRDAPRWVQQALGLGPLLSGLAVLLLRISGKIASAPNGYRLTDEGRQQAKGLVRSHRLWESYLAQHFELPADHLHTAAERVEHYVGPQLREELAAELADVETDPHGKAIPPENRAKE